MTDTYYICHQAKHIAGDRECTVTPYGAIDLYDPACWPKKLRLVGLVPAPPPAKVTEEYDEAEELICVDPGHHDKRYACARTPRRNGPTISSAGGHNWTPFFKKGQYIAVRARVLHDTTYQNTGKNIAADVGGRVISIKRGEALGLVEGPPPAEPDRSVIVRSLQPGCERFFGWSASLGAWVMTTGVVYDNSQPWTWEDLFNVHGPFDVFTPSGKAE